MTFSAPAKINLSLEVLHRRDDGFHELQTLVLPLPGLADQLTFAASSNYSLSCDTPGVPLDESNLVSRAVRLFEEATGQAVRFRINLEKRIPHGAGLGGGSSDAATTLLALNTLTEASLSLEDLAQLAASLGSDIPLFLHGKPAWCRGRGEKIQTLDLPFNHPLVLFKPSFNVSTPWAYQQWQTSRKIPGISYDPQPLGDLSLFNDLERPVFQKYLFLAQLKQDLIEHPATSAALMSGSGSTVFAVMAPHQDPHAFAEEMKQRHDPTLWTHVETSS